MGKRKVKSNHHYIEVSLVHTIFKEPADEGIIKKQLHARKWFAKEAIISVEEYVTYDQKIAKSRSLVFDKYSSRFYMTYHSPDEILQHLNMHNNPLGFKK